MSVKLEEKNPSVFTPERLTINLFFTRLQLNEKRSLSCLKKSFRFKFLRNEDGCDLLNQGLRGGDGKLLISEIKTSARINDVLLSNIQLNHALNLHFSSLLSASFIYRLRGVCEVFSFFFPSFPQFASFDTVFQFTPLGLIRR